MLTWQTFVKTVLFLPYVAVIGAEPKTLPPRCLDFQSPFHTNSTVGFCTDYADFGCCGESGERRLMKEYEYIQTQVEREDWDKCRTYVKDILCLKCSPGAAHLYDAFTSKAKVFPKLCGDYCDAFYDNCKNFLWFLDPGLAVKTMLFSKELFCKRINEGDGDSCYPDVGSGSSFKRETRQGVGAAPPCICLKEVGKRLANPLFARHANDGSGRLFVAEQRGRVLIYNSHTEKWNIIPFLDLRRKVRTSYLASDERGFYSIAFHPNFSQNKRFFITYAQRRKWWERLPDELKGLGLNFQFKVTTSEMTTTPWNPNRANLFSEKTVLEVPQPQRNHNGGELFFGEDGYLYTFQGDGGGAGDPNNWSQNKALSYGKVFRLDVDSDRSKPYTIPADNPFVGESGTKPEIYAYGLRNTWRCGVDPGDRTSGTSRGRVLCGDVGQYRFEEIDELKKGANYGWNSREGFACYDPDSCGNIGDEELPIATYEHSVGLSVIGGVFYRGCQSQNLNGYYIYGDFSTRRLFTLLDNGGSWTNEDLSLCAPLLCQGDLTSTIEGKILSFGQDEDGEAYILTSKSVTNYRRDGFMYKIVDPSRETDPSECESAVQSTKRVPLPNRNPHWTEAFKIQNRFGATPFSQSLIKKLIEEDMTNTTLSRS